MSLSDDCIDLETPWNEFLSAKFKRSFAYQTVSNRLPVIVTQVIDHLTREKDLIVCKYGEECREELKEAIGALSKLKNEMQTNKPLIPFITKDADTEQWNTFLKSSEDETGRPLCWFGTVWLHVECYMYRRIREAFAVTHHLNTHDPFRHLKEAAFTGSLPAILFIGERLSTQADETNFNVKKDLLQLLKLSLWGNRCDLSLSGGKAILVENPLDLTEQLDEFVLVNDLEVVCEALSSACGANSVIDIVLDNAGYELFTDLCLADFLIKHKLATKVRLHAKNIPWFVSDTMESDFRWMLETLTNDSNNPCLHTLGKDWKMYIETGKWSLSANSFWTLPYSYEVMKMISPELYAVLSESSLVIFKGDLNYRKLMGDINWPHVIPFQEGLRGFQPAPILSLRTIKADVVTGMNEGQAEKVAKDDPCWKTTGKFAVVSYTC